jgi:hypothetical protein
MPETFSTETVSCRRDETAYTLNAKCLDASIRTFSELIDDLEKGTIDRRPQELAERTFCPLWKRPYAAATLDWGRPAGDLYNLWRGLEFGNYPNPLGLPKLFLGEQVVAVRKIALLAERSKGEPGTIVDVIDDTLHVAANPGVVSLSDFFTLEGERVSIGTCWPRFHSGKVSVFRSSVSLSPIKLIRPMPKSAVTRVLDRTFIRLEPIEIPTSRDADQQERRYDLNRQYSPYPCSMRAGRTEGIRLVT